MRLPGKDGFTLMEVVVAVAIVAILAGAITPVVFRELQSARSEATSRELSGIEKGLLDFYADTGRFPSEAEGLQALITDPGVPGWQGPYVSDSQQDPSLALAADAFGSAYVYDLNPNVVPGGGYDLLVASPGVNKIQDAGSRNHPWNLGSAADDLFALVSTAAQRRLNEEEADRELNALGQACAEYYRDHAVFPAAYAVLVPDYLAGGLGNDALTDGWQTPYGRRLYQTGPAAPTLLVYSYGPDRADDQGTDDDLAVWVSSVPPGRKTTLFELEIAQAALNANSSLPLVGSWSGSSGIRAQLGLADVFDQDGWGHDYRVHASSRLVYSSGPDANPNQTADNLPTGVGP